MDDDAPSRGDVPADDLHGPLDAGERRRIVRVAGVKEAARLRRIGEPAANEDLGQHVPHAQLALKRQGVGRAVGGDLEPRPCGFGASGRGRLGHPQGGRRGPGFDVRERLGERGGLDHGAPA